MDFETHNTLRAFAKQISDSMRLHDFSTKAHTDAAEALNALANASKMNSQTIADMQTALTTQNEKIEKLEKITRRLLLCVIGLVVYHALTA